MAIEYQTQGSNVKRGRIGFCNPFEEPMTFKLCAIVAALVFCTTACGPDWNDCPTCRPGETSAESDGGEQIPVVVNVTVNVDQTQTQGQQQGQGQTQSAPPATTTPDAGTPPKDPPKTCRKVCTCYVERQHCDRGWHGTDHKGRCNPQPKYKKCVKEAVQCS
jgi:hypothetical protein